MVRKNVKRMLALALAASMTFGLAACNSGGSKSSSGSSEDTPLVYGISPLNQKFSPFFNETEYDKDTEEMTQAALLPTDRAGEVLLSSKDGETVEYNGTEYTYNGLADCEVTENEDGSVYYDIDLRDDVKFSDGEDVTIDDVIFTFYVYADPTYDGSATFYAAPVKGMEEYRSNMSTLIDLLIEAGEDNTDFTYWTEEQQTSFWKDYKAATEAFVQEIKDYCVSAELNEDGDTYDEVMANWGYEVAEDATEMDVFNTMLEAYGGSITDMTSTESAGSSFSDLMPTFEDYKVGVETGDSTASIEGIEKTGDYSMRITTTETDASFIYQLNIPVTPMHYYGSADEYDYDNNKFGFPKGDLSSVREKTTEPMGCGPYVFKKYADGVVSFEANENYYLGDVATKYVNFREVNETDKMNGILTGDIDVTEPAYNKDVVESIQNENSNGEVTGDKIITESVDNLGYGYMGINSHNVNVGGEPGSDASKNLRKGIATVIAVYRDVAIDSYYGEAAEVINYPISNTSWAAPQPTDADYKVAFSTDVEGNDIYTSDMDEEAKYEAAKEAALGYFEAAGYTVENGKLTAAPDGASLEYEVLIPADGTGDHPAFMMLSLASDALEEIGMNLIVTDLTNSTELWDGLDAHTVEMWCAAWGATPDPDMYQIYYSDIANGGENHGGDWDKYMIEDENLDQMILDARSSTDQEYRKTVYKSCLDTIVDWACEIPTYQRQNVAIFSAERIDEETLPGDVTPFYRWINEIANISVK